MGTGHGREPEADVRGAVEQGVRSGVPDRLP